MANNQYVNKVEYDGDVLIDLTSDTVEPSSLLSGYTAHDKSGRGITGELVTASPYNDNPEANGTPSPGESSSYSRGDHVHPQDVNKQNKAVTKVITLLPSNWDSATKLQTVAVTGVTANNLIEVSPAPSSWSAANAAGVYCTSQGTDSLAFVCELIPVSELSINVVIWG